MNNRIKEAREERGLTQVELAKRMNTSQQNIQRWETGSVNMRADTLVRMGQILNKSVAYLLGFSSMEETASNEVEVPLYGSIAAGTPIEMMPVEETFTIPKALKDKYPNAFLLKVEGESMNKIIPNGSYALVDPCSTVEREMQPYAVCVNGYDATIKRVKLLSNGIELIPDSNDPTYRSRVFDFGDPESEKITIIGRVVWYTLPYSWVFD